MCKFLSIQAITIDCTNFRCIYPTYIYFLYHDNNSLQKYMQHLSLAYLNIKIEPIIIRVKVKVKVFAYYICHLDI